jgi:putative aldouronate transport system permease protein
MPMFGIIIAFKDVSPFGGLEGILFEPFVGFKHFTNFFNSYFFWNIMGNTVVISGLKLLMGFPTPIILALLINEVRHTLFKRTTQTISYLPHFLSMVIIAGLVYTVFSVQGGLVNHVVRLFGGEPQYFLGNPKYFRSILVGAEVWQTVGWGSILYLAGMANLNPELYEAAMIDGANKWQQVWAITLPGISHVIVILFIFRIGGLLDAGFEQILLLYSPAVYGVADIIDTYVYRSGLLSLKYSFATAVGLFKSVLALILLLTANKMAHWLGHMGIW